MYYYVPSQLLFSAARGVEIYLVNWCCKNWNKLQPDGPLGLYADFTYMYLPTLSHPLEIGFYFLFLGYWWSHDGYWLLGRNTEE